MPGETTGIDPTPGQEYPPVEQGGNLSSDEEVQVRCDCNVGDSASSLTFILRRLQTRLGEAEELKQEGNDLFRLNKWNEALQSYRNGLARLPKRRHPPVPPATAHEEGDLPPAEGESSRTPNEADSPPTSGASAGVDSPLARECAKIRSVLNANIAACHVKLVRAHARGPKEQIDTLIRAKTKMPLNRALKVGYGPLSHERASQAHTQLCRMILPISERCNDGHSATRR